MQDNSLIREGETLDDLIIGQKMIIQPLKGYRFSIDAVLLAHFCNLKEVRNVVDLGTGSGIIPILLTIANPQLRITGIEMQPLMAERARRSVVLNRLDNQIKVETADIRLIKDYLPGENADLVVCNPPFWRKGEGKISQNEEEAIARHEITVELEDIIAAANYLLKENGCLAIVHRADRMPEALQLFVRHNLAVSRLRTVHSYQDKTAKLVLLEACKKKKSSFSIMPPLIIYDNDGEYCSELNQLYK